MHANSPNYLKYAELLSSLRNYYLEKDAVDETKKPGVDFLPMLSQKCYGCKISNVCSCKGELGLPHMHVPVIHFCNLIVLYLSLF